MIKIYFIVLDVEQGGNQIDYLMEHECISYKRAIKLLSEIYLIDLHEKEPPTQEELEIIKKYQNAIIGSEYLELLKRGEERLKKRNNPNTAFYQKRYKQIERIKNKEYDKDFIYKKPPQKIYLI